jgi:hypothetical protein
MKNETLLDPLAGFLVLGREGELYNCAPLSGSVLRGKLIETR